ncbi:MAG: CapA family protein [Spirochaetota bacterium]
MKLRIFFIFIFFSCAILPSCGQQKIDLIFTGDIMMHYAVKDCALIHSGTDGARHTPEGFEYLFAKVSPALESADYAVGNMEFPVSPPFIQDEFIFNCPKEVIPALKKSGFDAVNMANNHLLDQKVRGVIDTFGFLEEAELPYFGARRTEKEAREGIIFEKDGLKVGVISYSGVFNYTMPKNNPDFHYNDLNKSEKMLEDIRALKAKCDFLIVQPHDGVEYVQIPTEKQKDTYKKILNAGADMIIGHHPHTLQYAENVKTDDGRICPVFYSLGNFICNQTYCYPIKGSKDRLDIRDSILVKVSLLRENGALKKKITVIPIYTMHEMKDSKNGKYKDIQTLVIRDELAQLKEKLAAADGAEKPAIAAKIAFFEKQRKVIQKVVFKNGMTADTAFE